MKVLNKRTDVIPEGAVYVGRPSTWGNPFRIGRDGTREECVQKFRSMLRADLESGHREDVRRAIEALRGKDLVCWCAPEACHADVLLEIANDPV